MHTIYLDVPSGGAMLLFSAEKRSGVAITVPDEVWVTSMPVPVSVTAEKPKKTRAPSASPTGFPPRDLTEAAIIQVLTEHGGRVKIRQEHWNVYDELAARLGVSMESRRRLTEGTGEPAWRPEVGFARKNLEQRGELSPTAESGRGIWQLARRSS